MKYSRHGLYNGMFILYIADAEQIALLKGSHFYKLKMAWKAFDENCADDEQQKELLENHPFYKLKINDSTTIGQMISKWHC